MTQPSPYGGPYGSQFGPPPKKDRTVLWVGLGVGLVVLVACCFGGLFLVGLSDESDDDSSAESEVDTDAADESDGDESDEPEPIGGTEDNPAPVGTPAENRSTRYTILDVEVTDTLSTEFFTERPIGKFVVIELSIENISTRSINFFEDDLTLLVDGDEIDVDGSASIAIDDALIFEEISPGLTQRGSVAFDVSPKQAGKGVLRARESFSDDGPVYLSIE